MFVLCPHCQFLVAVDPVTGQPPAHCPRCDGAMAPPVDAPPPTQAVVVDEARVEDGAVDRAEPSPSAPTPAAQEPLVAGVAEEVAVADGVTDVAAAAIDDGAPAAQPTPSESVVPAPAATRTRAPRSARPIRRWHMPLAIAALALLLALQMLLADRARLAGDAQWRPTLAVLCGALRCGLPPWHEPAAFTLVDRDVRPDPRTPGVLHVRARFRNDARWPQAWPQVLLTLSDVDGRVAGARAFAPREYATLPATRNPIASGQVAGIAMDVVEPAPDIVAFTFDFR